MSEDAETIGEIVRQLKRMDADLDRRFSRLESKLENAVFVTNFSYDRDQVAVKERFQGLDGRFDKFDDFRTRVYIVFLVFALSFIANLYFTSLGG